MKIRRIPFDLKSTIIKDNNLNYNWAFDEITSLIGLGYSFYLEHIEYFCKFISNHYNKYLINLNLKAKDDIFIKQEMHHARYHKIVNAFLCEKVIKTNLGHPRVYSFYQDIHQKNYNHLIKEVQCGSHEALCYALRKIAIFESKNCISSFVFFEQFFFGRNFKRTLNISQNLSFLYLLAYHFTEEIEHCDVAVDIYETISGNKLWTKDTIKSEIQEFTKDDDEAIVSAIYCGNFFRKTITYETFAQSPFIKETKSLQNKYIKEDFNLNSSNILQKRNYIVDQWDNYWEPELRKKILMNEI